jgi:GNAT superfamily N-acetyltransferase
MLGSWLCRLAVRASTRLRSPRPGWRWRASQSAQAELSTRRVQTGSGRCKHAVMQADPVSLRPATPADAPVVADLLTEAGVAAWGNFLGEGRIRTANAGRIHPADVVAEDSSGVCGFVAWDVLTGEITRLYVHPRRWRSGVGRALLMAAEKALHAAGVRQAWLHTEQRGQACAFYERCGWQIDGPPLVRDWHGAQLVEPRYVKTLRSSKEP